MAADPVAELFEPELREALPRRPAWSRAPWQLWLRVALFTPPTLLVAWHLAGTSWLLLLATAGSAVEARIVDRRAAPGRYAAVVEYPRRGWSGAEQTVREEIPLSMTEWAAMMRARALPARRLGRGWLQVVRIERDGRALDGGSLALGLAFGLGPLAAATGILLWGRLAREWWLVAWGRTAQGRVRSRAQRGARFPRYSVTYDYSEASPRGASATLHGKASVSRSLYEQAHPGRPLTVLHSLWNPRWHVAYPFARFRAGGGGEARPD